MFWAIVTSVPPWLVGCGARVASTPSQSVNSTNPIPAQLISMSPCAPQICRCIKSWSRVDRVYMTLRSMEQFEPLAPRQDSINFLIPVRPDRQFESPFLQRGVCLCTALQGFRRRAPHFAAVCAGHGDERRDGWLHTRPFWPFFSDGCWGSPTLKASSIPRTRAGHGKAAACAC